MASHTTQTTLGTLTRIAVFGGAALVLGALVTGWLDTHRGESIPAVLQAKTTGITAGRVCRLAEVFVEPGAAVVTDQPLLRFSDERLDARLEAKQREIRQLTVEIRRVEAAAEVELAWRRRELQGDIYRAQIEQARLLQERLNRQVEQIAWQEHLKGLDAWVGESSSDLVVQPITLSQPRPNTARLEAVLKEDAAATAAEAVEAQLALCESQLTSLERLAANLDQKVRISAGIDVARTKLEQAEAELAALEQQREDLTIRSMGYGTVGLLHKQPGDRIEPGDVVLELLDEAQVTLKACLPTAAVTQIAPGQQVTILFPGDARRRGMIAAVPPQTTAADRSAGEARFELEIRPAGKLWPKLPVGSQVMVMLPQS